MRVEGYEGEENDDSSVVNALGLGLTPRVHTLPKTSHAPWAVRVLDVRQAEIANRGCDDSASASPPCIGRWRLQDVGHGITSGRTLPRLIRILSQAHGYPWPPAPVRPPLARPAVSPSPIVPGPFRPHSQDRRQQAAQGQSGRPSQALTGGAHRFRDAIFPRLTHCPPPRSGRSSLPQPPIVVDLIIGQRQPVRPLSREHLRWSVQVVIAVIGHWRAPLLG